MTSFDLKTYDFLEVIPNRNAKTKQNYFEPKSFVYGNSKVCSEMNPTLTRAHYFPLRGIRWWIW